MAGPILFAVYTAPIEDIIRAHEDIIRAHEDIIRAHGFSCVFYADDTQVYVTAKSDNRDFTIERLKMCIRDIKTWMVNLQLPQVK